MITDWIETQNFQFKRINERPWGGYELAISTDGGTSWAHVPKPFGSRIDEKLAFEQLLIEAFSSDILQQQLVTWLGEERVNQIKTIIKGKPDVSEHIHNESEGQ